MASASTSRDKRRYLTPAGGDEEVQERGIVTPPESARVAIDVHSGRKSLQLTPSQGRMSHKWHSNLDVLGGTPTTQSLLI